MDTIPEQLDMDGERGTPSASTPKVSSVLEHLVERPPSPDKELLQDIAATAVFNESPGGDPLVAQKARNMFASLTHSPSPPGNHPEDEFNRLAMDRAFNDAFAGYLNRNNAAVEPEGET